MRAIYRVKRESTNAWHIYHVQKYKGWFQWENIQFYSTYDAAVSRCNHEENLASNAEKSYRNSEVMYQSDGVGMPVFAMLGMFALLICIAVSAYTLVNS